jgi:hypothetical protein
MSESHKGKISCWIGRYHSEETKIKMSKSLKGIPHKNKGITNLKTTGENNGNSKITKEQSLDIKEMILNGFKLKEIAKIIGCSINIIYNINSKKTWKW